jgi:hypothetical protein
MKKRMLSLLSLRQRFDRNISIARCGVSLAVQPKKIFLERASAVQ